MVPSSPRIFSSSQKLSRRRLLGGIAGLTGGLAASSLLSACGDQKILSAANPDAKNVSTTTRSTGASPALRTGSPEASMSVDKVRFAWWTDVGTLSPFQFSTTGPGGVVLLSFIFDTLTWKDDKAIIPWLGKSWEATPDGTSYTFAIVDNAVWHDDQPLTVDDVAFSFTYYKTNPFKWMSSGVVKSALVRSDSTVTLTLNRPAANFLEEIAGIVPVIPKHIWETVSDPAKYSDARASLGSGPYVFREHDAAAGAYRLTPFSKYWRGKPIAQELRQITIPAQQELQIMQKRLADLSQSTDATVVDLLSGDPRLSVDVTAPLSVVRLAVNTQRPPFDRKEVRQAIMYALDRALIARTITRGPAIINGVAIVPPGTPWFNPSIKQYPFDPNKARELLGGTTISVDLLADPSAREPQLMQPMLEAAGIKLTIRLVDVATRLQLLGEGNFQLALTSHIGIGGDPDYLRRWYAGEESNAFARGSIFENPQYAQLGDDEVATLDPVKRKRIVFQMQEILAEELPTLVLYHRSFYWIYNTDAFTPMETWGGLMNGIPFPNNKLTLIRS